MKTDLTKKIFKNFSIAETKVAEGKPRTLVVKITSPTPDRSQDIVEPKGMNAKNFMKNPVVLFAHNYSELPIAKCTNLEVVEDGVLATVQFMEAGKYGKSDVVYEMYKTGFLNAWSIGFMPSGKDAYEENDEGGYTFKNWELLEFSSVPVPANAEALTVMRSKGFDVDKLFEKEKKDEDNPTDPGYTDETKITDLTVGQLKNLIDECLDAEEEENDEGKSVKVDINLKDSEEVQKTIDDLKKQVEEMTIKVGRTISAKHESLLSECVTHCQKVVENCQTILDTVAEEEDDGKGLGKTESSVIKINVLNGLVNSLTHDLKKTDKDVGLALRTLKLFKGRGGEK